MSKTNELITKPIPQLIRRIAIPASVGFFFNTMYNVVDTFFGGLASTQAIAALSLSFPVFFIIIAFGSGIGTGATALISNSLGSANQTEAKKFTAQSLSFTIIVSLFLTIIGILASPPLFRLLGATGEYLDLALSYINVIFYGTIFFGLNFTLNSILNSVGDTKTFRNFLIFGFVLNPFLNYWFMFGGLGLPALGLRGIALATVVVQALGVVYLLQKVLETKLFAWKFLRKALPERSSYLELSRQGVPASLNMMTVAIGIFVITYFVSQFGQAAVAAYGVATRVEQLFLLPTIGFNVAALTLVGQNNGAKLFDRVREVISLTLKYSLWIMTAAAVLIFLFAEPLMAVFTQDQEVIKIGGEYLKIAAFATWAYPILFIITSVLQGLKKPAFAVWIGLFRQIIAPVVVFWALINIFDLKIFGVWWGVLIIVWSSALISIWYLARVSKSILK